MFRFDRALTLSLFGPLTSLTIAKGPHIPILMYHSISDDREDGVHPYYRVNTSPAVFAEHMKYLQEQHSM
jgi:hypothetical protein